MGSMATGLGAGGGFCAGSHVVCQHQRINSSASVFSASLPAMLATTSSHAISVLQSDPTILTTLQSNTLLFRQILNKLEALPIEIPECDPSYTPPPASIHPPIANKDAIISVPSHPQSALIHIFLLNPPPTLEEEEALLQEVVDETVNTAGLLITRARRLRGQETFEPEPSLKVCISAAFSRKEIEKAAQGLKAALIKVAGSE
jgi:serine palmitoyltransferase